MNFRVENSSASCIDNIITNTFIPGALSGIIVEDISDHFPVFYVLPKSNRQPHQRQYDVPHPRSHTFTKDNVKNLSMNLANTDWTNLFSDEDPTNAAHILENVINEQVEITCPPSKHKQKKQRSINLGFQSG